MKVKSSVRAALVAAGRAVMSALVAMAVAGLLLNPMATAMAQTKSSVRNADGSITKSVTLTEGQSVVLQDIRQSITGKNRCVPFAQAQTVRLQITVKSREAQVDLSQFNARFDAELNKLRAEIAALPKGVSEARVMELIKIAMAPLLDDLAKLVARVAALEDAVGGLKGDVADLRRDFEAYKVANDARVARIEADINLIKIEQIALRKEVAAARADARAAKMWGMIGTLLSFVNLARGGFGGGDIINNVRSHSSSYAKGGNGGNVYTCPVCHGHHRPGGFCPGADGDGGDGGSGDDDNRP